MAIVDERGRLFGRWNLFDLAVVLLLVGVVPLAYAAYVLFRDQPPTLVAVTPGTVQEAQEFTIKIKGTNLRPYMRVSAGPQQARDFIFKSTEEAELPFTYLAPGKYDLILYDSAQERFRLRDALTITRSALPSTEIVAIGAFGNLDADGASKLTVGTRLADAGEIMAVGTAVPDRTDVFSGSKVVGVQLRGALQLPAVVKLVCRIQAQQGTPYCVSNNVTIAPRALLTVPTPLGTTPFQVQRVRSAAPLQRVTVGVRLTGAPSTIGQVHVGDVDTGGSDSDVEVLARVESVARPGGENATAADVQLSANVQQVNGGWLYDSAPLRLGSSIMLRTTRYELAGVVIKIGAQ
jgi:hypothetical protein